jgi:hypothetical protein
MATSDELRAGTSNPAPPPASARPEVPVLQNKLAHIQPSSSDKAKTALSL